MKTLFTRLWEEEDGADTAEWVVITAMVIGVAVVVYNGVLSDSLVDAVDSIDVKVAAAQ
jgi:Flp pilus assembly pilin Flp